MGGADKKGLRSYMGLEAAYLKVSARSGASLEGEKVGSASHAGTGRLDFSGEIAICLRTKRKKNKNSCEKRAP